MEDKGNELTELQSLGLWQAGSAWQSLCIQWPGRAAGEDTNRASSCTANFVDSIFHGISRAIFNIYPFCLHLLFFICSILMKHLELNKRNSIGTIAPANPTQLSNPEDSESRTIQIQEEDFRLERARFTLTLRIQDTALRTEAGRSHSAATAAARHLSWLGSSACLAAHICFCLLCTEDSFLFHTC